jgi:hypothetical protein
VKAVVISTFPACGKTTYSENQAETNPGRIILDSDSSGFSWIKKPDGSNSDVRDPIFPRNYVLHIQENLERAEIVFVSSHKIVRSALSDSGIPYFLVFPGNALKGEWIKRMRRRGNDEKFVNFIVENWEKFQKEMEAETYPRKICLTTAETAIASIFVEEILKLSRGYK